MLYRFMTPAHQPNEDAKATNHFFLAGNTKTDMKVRAINECAGE